jgi:hypothetical protein
MTSNALRSVLFSTEDASYVKFGSVSKRFSYAKQ